MEEKLFDLVGLGIPFCLAALTAWVFSWLDNNIADEHSQVISSWLRGRSHNKPDLGNLIISAFDRIYTSPLLTFRAFLRSAVISAVIWGLLYCIPWLVSIAKYWDAIMTELPPGAHFFRGIIAQLVTTLLTTILVDYASLFVVRRLLNLAQVHPMVASFISSIVGFVVIIVSFIVALVLTVAAGLWLDPPAPADTPSFDLHDLSDLFEIAKPFLLQSILLISRPAFVVHLWLPLFALSSLIVKLAFLLFRAVEWAQWFLKQGDAHPLKAIGIVATIIVFGSAMLVKEAWTVL